MMAYGTDSGFTDWLAAYGYTLPAEAPSAAILRARGAAYLDGAYEAMWTGQRTDPANQIDAWPRAGALFNCVTAIDDSVIPQAIVNASYRAAWLEAETPGILVSSFSSGQRVKRSKVDVIEEEYFDDGGAVVGSVGGFVDSGIDGMVRQFVCHRGKGFLFQAVG